MNQSPAPVVGLIGGIGSGKSSLATSLGQRLRCVLLDADREGHRVLELPAVQTALREAFGSVVFSEEGTVSRSALGNLVFGDQPVHLDRRHQLEAIVHPVIRQRLQAELKQHQADEQVDLIVLDAAVMLEAGWSPLCDLIVFLDTPESLRRSRVMQQRGWSAAELARREASQWSLDRKRKAADIVVDNSGSMDVATDALMAELIIRFPRLKSPVQRAALSQQTETTSP